MPTSRHPSQHRRRARSAARTPAFLHGDNAVAVARAALIEEGGAAAVGEHVSVTSHGDGVAEHRFAATVPGYCGWEWCVILACVPGSNRITVNEVALLPGAQALQAPAWVPWADRVRPGDLKPGDLMPRSDDHRLDDAPAGHPSQKILSTEGLHTTMARWRSGDFGPCSDLLGKRKNTALPVRSIYPCPRQPGQRSARASTSFPLTGASSTPTTGAVPIPTPVPMKHQWWRNPLMMVTTKKRRALDDVRLLPQPSVDFF